jgi:hypothetical protein
MFDIWAGADFYNHSTMKDPLVWILMILIFDTFIGLIVLEGTSPRITQAVKHLKAIEEMLQRR